MGIDPKTLLHAGTFAEPVDEDEMPIEEQMVIIEEISRLALDGAKRRINTVS